MIATAEYELVTESAGLVERPGRAVFGVRGGEVADFLQGQVSNDVESLVPGRGCYATLLTHKGKIRADLRILRTEDGWLLDAEPMARPVIAHMLETYSLGRDVRFEDMTEERAVLSLIGPAAREGVDPAPPDDEHAHVAGELGLYVSTDAGVDVICADPAAAREALALEEVPEEVAECLRIESGRPRLGLELGNEVIPQEAGINERAVDFEKGCYVGQETVARLHYKGKPNRHLRGLRLSEPAERGTPVLLGEKQVATVGSSCVSPVLGPIALAIVRREAAPGDTVQVDGADAKLVELPFRRG